MASARLVRYSTPVFRKEKLHLTLLKARGAYLPCCNGATGAEKKENNAM